MWALLIVSILAAVVGWIRVRMDRKARVKYTARHQFGSSFLPSRHRKGVRTPEQRDIQVMVSLMIDWGLAIFGTFFSLVIMLALVLRYLMNR